MSMAPLNSRWRTRIWVLLGLSFLASTSVRGVIATSDLPVKLGEWNTNYSDAKALAEAQCIPMVLFWGGASCSVCKSVEAAVDSAEFREWQESRKLVMVFQIQTSGSGEMYEFTRNDSGTYPFICVYWPKSDGTATTNRFSGVVKGAIPWPATGKNTAEHFINSVESCIVGYEPAENNSGDFLVGDTENDRLEAVPGATKSVAVPLLRTRASVPFLATNRIVATYPRMLGETTNEVVWAEGEETKYPQIVFPVEFTLLPNEQITLTLLDSQDQEVGTRHIWLVEEPENSPKNPCWIGERTAETLGWGEWTMDIDVATNKAAAAEGDAWTLVGIVGSLWCPDCFKTDEHFLADPAVTNWAAANHVTFVSADIPNIPQTAPALLSYQTNYVRSAEAFTSGAGYLSRHEVDPEAAAACLARNYHFAQDLYHRPEDTNKNRTGVPIFVLLNKQGEMVGRFTRLANTSPTDSSHNMAYLARLSEMIQMAGDADEMGNNHVSTTSSTLAVPGGTFSGRISHADAIDTMKLGGVASGVEVTISATANNEARNVRVTLSVIEVVDGSSRTIASQKGNLDGLVVTAALEAVGAEWFVQLSASVTSTAASNVFSAEYAGAEGTVTPYTLNVVEMVLVPRETAMSNAAAAGEATVAVRLAEGETYRFDGLPQEGWEEALEVVDAGKKLYRARTTGDVALPVAEAGGTLEYQQWHPGEVAFVGGDLTLEEKADLVEVAVVRTNGVSGAAAVTVKADLSQIAAGRLTVGQCDASGTFTPGEPTLEWAEGEEEVRTFWLKVQDDVADDGDQTAVLTLESVDGTILADDRSTLSVTVQEDDQPLPGRIAITATDPIPAKGLTVYAPAGETVLFDVSRLDGAEGEATATLMATMDGEEHPELLELDALAWPDKCKGDEVTHTVRIFVPEDAAGSKIVVTVAALGAKTDVAAKRLTVVVNAVTAPAFKQDALSCSAVRSAKFSAAVDTQYKGTGTLKTTKIDGSLPPGLKATFANGALRIVGTPTRAGTYRVAYRVTATEGGVSVPGGTVVFTFDVAEVTDVCPALAKARTFNDIQIVDKATKRLVGLLTLTVPPTGRASARYTSVLGRASFAASGWEYNAQKATFTAVLTSAKEVYEFYEIHVTQQADGTVVIEMNDPQFPLGGIMTCSVRAEDAWSRAKSAEDWRGSYTVACPYRAYKAESNSDTAYAVHATGSPCFSLRMATKSACNAGRVTYAGWLANGTRVTGSATLTRGADGETALLPLYGLTGKDFFTAVCQIEKGKAAAWEAEKGGEYGFGQRAITAPNDVLGWWTHTEKTDDATFSCSYDVYGSYWTAAANLPEVLEATGVTAEADFATDMADEDFAESVLYGAVEEVPAATVTIGANALSSDSATVSMRLDPQTGLVSGTFRARFEKGAVTVNWRAAALPGWTGCGCHGEPIDLPFFIGAGWFQDRIYYREADALTDRARVLSLKRGCGVAAETKVAE